MCVFRVAGIIPAMEPDDENYVDPTNGNPDFKYETLKQIMIYMASPWNILDVVTIGPFYLQFFGIQDRYAILLRLLRVARMVRLARLGKDQFVKEVLMMKHTIQNSFKLVAALIVVCVIILSLFGVACYFIEQVS